MTKKSAVVGISLGVVTAALLGGAFANRYGGAFTDSSCLVNTKQCTVALLFYSADFDERYPLPNWLDAIKRYAKDEAIFRCSKLQADSQGFGRALEMHLVGKRIADIPADAVSLFEVGALGRNVVINLAGIDFRHGTQEEPKSMVSFNDGHCQGIVKGTKLREAP